MNFLYTLNVLNDFHRQTRTQRIKSIIHICKQIHYLKHSKTPLLNCKQKDSKKNKAYQTRDSRISDLIRFGSHPWLPFQSI